MPKYLGTVLDPYFEDMSDWFYCVIQSADVLIKAITGDHPVHDIMALASELTHDVANFLGMEGSKAEAEEALTETAKCLIEALRAGGSPGVALLTTEGDPNEA